MESKWYFEQFGQRRGPMTRVQLLVCVQRGEIGPEDLVWSDTEPQAVPLSRASALVAMPVAAEVLAYEGTGAQETIVSQRALDLLAESRPWVRFVGVTSLFLAGLMLFSGIWLVSEGEDVGLVILAIWAPMTPFLLLFGVLLNRFASRIGALLRMGRTLDLELALDAQVRAWISAGFGVGLVVVVLVVLLVLTMVA